MFVYVTDTHLLVWFTLGKRQNLSGKARAAFESAEAGQSFIYVPAIVLWETALLERAGRIKLNGGFALGGISFKQFRFRTRPA